MRAAPCWSSGTLCLPSGRDTRTVSGPVCVIAPPLGAGDGAALQVAFEAEQRNRAAVLFERDRQRGESSAGRFDDDVERAGLSDDPLGPFDS